MKIYPLPIREKIIVIIENLDDVIVLKHEDFLFGIFSYYNKKGEKLFTAKSTDVEVYMTGDVYQKAVITSKPIRT